MSADWMIDDVLEKCPNIERGVVIDAILAEAASSADLRRFLISFAYAERRKQRISQELAAAAAANNAPRTTQQE